jgi:LmbE family N-acetylglucosaminyl deacetylase
VVVAHPGDESFGFGAVIDRLATDGVGVRVLCLTHGEASTLGADTELGTAFVGITGDDVSVDRSVQQLAIRCHRNQASDNRARPTPRAARRPGADPATTR